MSHIWKGKKVVIVDDSRNVRDDLQKLFSNIGLNVVGVADGGGAAIELVKQHEPDLVSLDIIMPEMDGIECFQKLKNVGGQREYLFITVLASEPRVVDFYKDEIAKERFIPKPVDQQFLTDRLDKIFESLEEVISVTTSE